MAIAVADAVAGMFAGKDVDEDIINYVVSCLDDETFEFGDDGQEIYDTVGPMLVRRHIVYVCLEDLNETPACNRDSQALEGSPCARPTGRCVLLEFVGCVFQVLALHEIVFCIRTMTTVA